MRGILVAIDLETTGLDAAEAHIIEIGAAKFRENEIVETFSTLVDPGIPIPPRVTDITGIRTEDLIGAPKIADVLPRLIDFVGNAPVVGHNVDFDLRFLHKQNVLTANEAIDTYELAAVLMPTAERYNLNALMQKLNIAPEGHYHRALTDAIADARLYAALWQKLISDVPYELVGEIASLARNLNWRGKPAFEAALKVREGERPGKTDPVLRALSAERHQPVRQGDVTAPRIPENVRAQSVHQAFESGERVVFEQSDQASRVENYLLPAAVWALKNNQPIILATATDTLRRRVQQIAGEANLSGLRIVRMRSRADYLCPAQLDALRKGSPSDVEELRVIAKTLIWLATGGNPSGMAREDERLSIRGPGEQIAWGRLSARSETCNGERCQTLMGGICPLWRDRQAARQAHLVVVDHAPLIADLYSNDPILPPFHHIVVDEAHQLEDSLTDALRSRYDAPAIKRQIATLAEKERGKSRRGLLDNLLEVMQPVLPEKNYETLTAFIGDIVNAAKQMSYHVDNLFKAIQSFLEVVSDTRASDFAIQIRLSEDLRQKAAFSQVRAAWSILGQFAEALSIALDNLQKRVNTWLGKYTVPDLLSLKYRIEASAQAMQTMYRWLEGFVNGSDSPQYGEPRIYWAEISPDTERIDRLSLHSAPLNVAGPLKKHLWDRCQTAIVTDETLRTGASYDFVRGRLALGDFKVIEPDPIATPPSLMVFLPSDMPDSAEKDRHQRHVERGIIDLASSLSGRLMVLFSGFTQLRQSSQHLAARLALGNIAVFDQSDGTSQSTLLDGFRKAERSVLLGVRGFWEDWDLSDLALSALVLVRLPFPVPSDPIYSARLDMVDDPFNQYTVPNTILRFRQSVERLLGQRRAMVSVFDRRMITREYGSTFIDSLPPCEVRRAPLSDLGATARAWLANT